MDKCILPQKDIDALLTWRDNNQELVRSAPMPIKAIEILCVDQQITIKGIRDDKEHLRLYMTFRGHPMGRCEYHILPNKQWLLTKDTMTKNLPPEVLITAPQSMLTIYASLMALMVYGNKVTYEDFMEALEELEEAELRTPVPMTEKQLRQILKSKPKPAPKQQGITYIIHTSKSGKISARVKGGHASPSGVFTVRGHYRHYKSGKVVWIPEFKKGEGKKKRKTYKTGTIDRKEA